MSTLHIDLEGTTYFAGRVTDYAAFCNCILELRSFVTDETAEVIQIKIYGKVYSVEESLQWCSSHEEELLDKKNITHKRITIKHGVTPWGGTSTKWIKR